MTENRCVQLATIQRNAAGAVLVADVKAKHLDASPVDLLRLVKVPCRRCAPMSVLGCPSVPRSAPHVGVLVYPLECSCGTRQHARVLLRALECSMPSHARSLKRRRFVPGGLGEAGGGGGQEKAGGGAAAGGRQEKAGGGCQQEGSRGGLPLRSPKDAGVSCSSKLRTPPRADGSRCRRSILRWVLCILP